MPRSKSPRIGYAGTGALFNSAGGIAHPAWTLRRFDGPEHSGGEDSFRPLRLGVAGRSVT